MSDQDSELPLEIDARIRFLAQDVAGWSYSGAAASLGFVVKRRHAHQHLLDHYRLHGALPAGAHDFGTTEHLNLRIGIVDLDASLSKPRVRRAIEETLVSDEDDEPPRCPFCSALDACEHLVGIFSLTDGRIEPVGPLGCTEESCGELVEALDDLEPGLPTEALPSELGRIWPEYAPLLSESDCSWGQRSALVAGVVQDWLKRAGATSQDFAVSHGPGFSGHHTYIHAPDPGGVVEGLETWLTSVTLSVAAAGRGSCGGGA